MRLHVPARTGALKSSRAHERTGVHSRPGAGLHACAVLPVFRNVVAQQCASTSGCARHASNAEVRRAWPFRAVSQHCALHPQPSVPLGTLLARAISTLSAQQHPIAAAKPCPVCLSKHRHKKQQNRLHKSLQSCSPRTHAYLAALPGANVAHSFVGVGYAASFVASALSQPV